MNENLLFNCLLTELALVLEPEAARGAAGALCRYWGRREGLEASLERHLARIPGLSPEGLRGVESEVSRLVSRFGSAHATRGGASRFPSEHTVASHGDGIAASVLTGLEAPLKPLSVERYTDFEPIGAGGMGVVYRAFDRELAKEVALKVLRLPSEDAVPRSPFDVNGRDNLDPNDPVVSRRRTQLLLEARLTSSLQHPGVPAVYDVGQTPSGRPGYAMRYVAGRRTLHDAIRCAETQEARLDLLDAFLRCCDTMAYVHSRGVLHRDLKPTNVCLGEFGEVIVLDWGLASLSPTGGLRAQPRAVGTPGYMSPEAAGATREPVDARSDVYSLGAMLHEILTGKRPAPDLDVEVFGRDRLLDRTRRARPWTSEEDAGLCEICHRALAPRPADRHRSVEDLAADIRSWRRTQNVEREVDLLAARAESAQEAAADLEGEALQAQLDRVTALALRIQELKPDSQRAGFMVRECERERDRAMVERDRRSRRRLLTRVAVFATIVALVSLGIVTALLDRRRAEAEDATARAETLATTIIFGLHGKLTQLGRLELLGSVARNALTYYEGAPFHGVDPQVVMRRSVAITNIADVYRAEGRLEEALSAYRSALSLRIRLVGEDPTDRSRRRRLGAAHAGVGAVLKALGRLEDAREHLETSLGVAQGLHDEDPGNPDLRADLARRRSRLAWALDQVGDSARAPHLHESAVTEFNRLLAGRPGDERLLLDLSDAQVGRAESLVRRGETDAAIHAFEAGMRALRALVARDPEDVVLRGRFATHLEGVGDVLLKLGRHAEARAHLYEALSMRQWLAEHDPSNQDWQVNLAAALNVVGDALHRAGDRSEAIVRFEQAVKIRKGLSEADPENVRWLSQYRFSLRRLGDLLEEAGEREAALQRFHGATAVARHAMRRSPDAVDATMGLIGMLAKLGSFHYRHEEYAQAAAALIEARTLGQALKARVSERPAVHVQRATVERYLGDVRAAQQDPTRAEACYRTALEAIQAVVEHDPAQSEHAEAMAGVHVSLGRFLSRTDRPEDARKHLQTALSIRKRLVASEPNIGTRWRLAYTWAALGSHHRTQDQLDEAAAAYAQAVERMGEATTEEPNLSRQLAEYKAKHRFLSLLAGQRPAETADDEFSLGCECHRKQQYAAAVPHFVRALEDPHIRGDLEEGALYLAARSAAQASVNAAPPEAERLLALGWTWLTEYVDRLRRHGSRSMRTLSREPSDAEDGRRGLTAIEKQLEWLRTGDAALEPFRGKDGFPSLFVRSR